MVTFDVVGAVHETVMVLVFSWVRVGLMGAGGGTVEDGTVEDGIDKDNSYCVPHSMKYLQE